jgi:hypothetical protein
MKRALGYARYVSEGSGYLVVINGGNLNGFLKASAHEAMHILGVGDIGFDTVDRSLADGFDIMKYWDFSRIRVSNVHIYMMLKAREAKTISEWKNMNDELLGFAKEYGLHYAQ